MNYSRLALAALGGTVAYFAFGALVFVLLPQLIKEARKHPALFRPEEQMNTYMPVGLVGTVIAVLIAAVLYAMASPGGSSAALGARFGILMGLFVVCAFVLHNYANFNVSLKLTIGQAVAYFAQWTIVCTVIGLIYKPVTMP
jgi:uncharacterized membrane protein